MLSYQHGYHAGNLADLHKHIVLCALWQHLKRKPRPLTYFDSHAGRGYYDLDDAMAAKTTEFRDGIGRFTGGAPSFDRARAHARQTFSGADGFYPGSPALILGLKSPDDRVVLCELHPREHAALVENLGQHAEIHHRDGFVAINALAPMTPRRGLVLIDPSYETEADYDEMPRRVSAIIKKWPQAVIAIWYPLLVNHKYQSMIDKLDTRDGLVSQAIFLPSKLRMNGSGMLIINPPFGARRAIEAELAAARSLFAQLIWR